MIQEIVESVHNLFGTRKIRRKPRVLTKEEHQIDKSKVSPFAISVCQKLKDAGFKAFIVGGAVRDLLIDHTPKDFDVATDATPEQVKKITRRAIIIGRRFRLVHVTRNAETIEVATFRGLRQDGVEKDRQGRVIDDNVFGEQFEDAARRDFTVNAMYYDPLEEEVYDYHNGLLDIKKKRIRMIGDPELRYREDPVRILRAIRIAAKLGFKIDPKTSQPIRGMQKLLLAVPEPRLFDEIMKMLMSGASVECMRLLDAEGVNVNIPLLREFLSAKQDPFLLKALEKSDARVAHGKPISQSFIFATLFWGLVKKEIEKVKKEEPELTIPRQWQMAIANVADNPLLKGIQRRFFRDMEEIWRLQPRFERRTSSVAFKLIEHPRFRAAYDFLLIRASCGEVTHELADWWTAFEEAPADERKDMIQDLVRQSRMRSRAGDSKVALDEPKKKRRPRKRKAAVVSSSGVPQKSAENTVVPEIKQEASVEKPKTAVLENSIEISGTPKEQVRVIPSQSQLQAEQTRNSYTDASEKPARRKPRAKSVLLTTPKKK